MRLSSLFRDVFNRVIERCDKRTSAYIAAVSSVAVTVAAAASSGSEDGSDLELVQVQVITRHGLRTPLSGQEFLGSLPWTCQTQKEPLVKTFREGVEYDYYHGKDSSAHFGTCHTGQLTDAGRIQIRELGKQLRERYVKRDKAGESDLPNGLFNEAELKQFSGHLDGKKLVSPNAHIRIRSSDSRRTIETAYELMRGFISPSEQEELSLDVNVMSHKHETLYPRLSTCPRLREVWRKMNSSEKNSFKNEVRLILQKSFEEGKMTKEEFDYWSARSVAGLCNTLSTVMGHHLPNIAGLSNEDVEKVCEESGKEYAFLYKENEIGRLAIGRFVGQLVHHIEKHSQQDSSLMEDIVGLPKSDRLPRMLVYSGHDNTISPLLNLFQVFDGKHPSMASSIIFELYKQKTGNTSHPTTNAVINSNSADNYYVKLLYNLKEKEMPGCDNKALCPLPQFLRMVEAYVPKDYHEECKIERETTLYQST